MACAWQTLPRLRARWASSHHGDGASHTHEERSVVEQTAVDREAAHAEKVDKDGAYAALHAATVGLLAGKGVVTRDELRRQVELLDASHGVGLQLHDLREAAGSVACRECDHYDRTTMYVYGCGILKGNTTSVTQSIGLRTL